MASKPHLKALIAFEEKLEGLKGKIAHKTFRAYGRVWIIPKLLIFNIYRSSQKGREYEVIGFRKPKRDEWYLCEEDFESKLAPAELSKKYLIVNPIGPKKSLKNSPQMSVVKAED